MSPFVGFLVEHRWELSVRFWWDDSNDTAFLQVSAQPVRIKGPVRCPAMVCFQTMKGGQQVSGCQAADQRVGLAYIVGLSRHQAKVDEVTEGVRQSQYIRRYAAARAADGLAMRPPFAP